MRYGPGQLSALVPKFEKSITHLRHFLPKMGENSYSLDDMASRGCVPKREITQLSAGRTFIKSIKETAPTESRMCKSKSV